MINLHVNTNVGYYLSLTHLQRCIFQCKQKLTHSYWNQNLRLVPVAEQLYMIKQVPTFSKSVEFTSDMPIDVIAMFSLQMN